MQVETAPKTGIISRIDRLFDRLIAGWNPYQPEKLKARGLAPVEMEEATVRRRGVRFILIAAAVFLVWSVTAPLDAGSVMPGSVTVVGYRKAVQHPTGGVVSRVLVSEGDKVQRGQVLVQINPLETAANEANLEQEYINLLVSESRAKAELMGRPIIWDPELASLDPVQVAEAKNIQTRIYSTRAQQVGEQVQGLQSQMAGLQGAVRSHRVQLNTLSEELANVESLAKDGFVPKTQVNNTLRSQVEQQAALQSAEAETGKIRAQIAQIRSERQTEIAKELAELQKNRQSVAPKLQAARFAQSLTEIRAPVSGTVVNLKVFTEGGVIGGGEMLMEVVPDDGTLVVEAKVPPTSIDSVKVGQAADVRFTAFNSATTPVVEGRVRAVGVDKLKAQPGENVSEGEDYYLAQIETTPEALKALGDRQLRAGMPAEVLVKRGQRTFMSYLLKPLTDKLAVAFRD